MMRASFAVLNTSESEGVCGALLEAMALGVPVVARRNGSNENFIVHQVLGSERRPAKSQPPCRFTGLTTVLRCRRRLA